MPTYATFALMLVPVGMSALILITSAMAIVQLSVAPEMRGRVMAIYLAIFMGGVPIGAPIIGWVGAEHGARWTIGVGGIAALLTAVAALIWLARARRLRLRDQLPESPHLQITEAELVSG